jgi:hypothetical protein
MATAQADRERARVSFASLGSEWQLWRARLGQILPLIFALIVVSDYERKRWRTPVPVRGVDPDALGNLYQ